MTIRQSWDSFQDSATIINSKNLVTLLNCLTATESGILRSTLTQHGPKLHIHLRKTTATFRLIIHKLVKQNYSNACLLPHSDAFNPPGCCIALFRLAPLSSSLAVIRHAFALHMTVRVQWITIGYLHLSAGLEQTRRHLLSTTGSCCEQQPAWVRACGGGRKA